MYPLSRSCRSNHCAYSSLSPSPSYEARRSSLFLRSAFLRSSSLTAALLPATDHHSLSLVLVGGYIAHSPGPNESGPLATPKQPQIPALLTVYLPLFLCNHIPREALLRSSRR